ncbi:hypothetical protein Nepgr_033345 [Nepenthes gracilis]|uniref:Gag-pol polyprotein n=1 Tax=Nepenthes gracilis TaxID=150966 RepID=A0AAD3TMH4_NEPGR|nr:hypothetical protein Nepgr_033345 [Nepenthes gracilis]
MCTSGSLSVPPFFDGSNYAYWKVRMRAFLKSLDERVWARTQVGWTPPTSSSGNEPKALSSWTKEELDACNLNSKGLHAIFMAVSPDEFKRISMCETSKDTCDILEITHEGTKLVKNLKLQMLTTRFEKIKMKDDETFDEFYAQLNDIVNFTFNLGERIPKNRIVRKVLRSLPERFRPKVTAIKKSKDLDKLKIEELVGSLQTYEHTLPQSKKNKSLALKSSREERNRDSDEESCSDDDFALFVKKFKKFLKKNNSSSEKMDVDLKRSHKFEKKDRRELKDHKSKNTQGVQCHECKGFGHYRAECPNLKRQQGQAFKANVTLSVDEEEEGETCFENDPVKYMAFMTSICDHSVEDLNHSADSVDESEAESDGLQEAYDKLFRVCLNVKKQNKTLNSRVIELEQERLALQSELDSTTQELENLKISFAKQFTTLESELEASRKDLK